MAQFHWNKQLTHVLRPGRGHHAAVSIYIHTDQCNNKQEYFLGVLGIITIFLLNHPLQGKAQHVAFLSGMNANNMLRVFIDVLVN